MKFKLYISYDDADETIAIALMKFLERVYLNSEVWMSGRDLSGGQLWIKETRDHLKNANAIVALITPYSIQSPWVLFEAGAGFIENKTIPLCADSIMIQNLEPPISLLRICSFSEQGLRKLTNEISVLAEISKPAMLPFLDETLQTVNDFVQLRRGWREMEEFDTASIEKCRSFHSDLTPLIVEPDPEINKELSDLDEELRQVVIKSIDIAGRNFDVPDDKQLNTLILSELIEMSRALNAPFPEREIRSYQYLQLLSKKNNLLPWEKLNIRNKVADTRNRIQRFSKTLV